MDRNEALYLLSFHSGRNPDIENPKWGQGFLASLRKYSRIDNENSFIEVMECLKVIKEDFNKNELSRDLIADLYGIFYYTNLWIGKGGILENRLTEEERKKIDIRMKIYSYVLASLLDYSEEGWQEAIGEYEDYLLGYTNYD